jgi:hypothetical protein
MKVMLAVAALMMSTNVFAALTPECQSRLSKIAISMYQSPLGDASGKVYFPNSAGVSNDSGTVKALVGQVARGASTHADNFFAFELSYGCAINSVRVSDPN